MSVDVCLYVEVDTGGKSLKQVVLYDSNITNNMTMMASEAGLYKAIWRPEENGFKTTGSIIEVLRAGIALMEADPERFKKLNSLNGWGAYGTLLQFSKEYLDACEKHPKAKIDVW